MDVDEGDRAQRADVGEPLGDAGGGLVGEEVGEVAGVVVVQGQAGQAGAHGRQGVGTGCDGRTGALGEPV
ncbi:hypothetical protein [Kitasatospora sp. MAA19]|uniref:hypothetical protein n=1 Tax=Kitasatospora sp. MAA19 TaxID=3035090 RepID=UPI00247346CE|nr:hypothetical protein [Kitasatospora sp. MAA19]